MLHREKTHFLLLAVIGVAACSESPTNDSASGQARQPYFTVAARTGGPLDVPEVRMDLPPTPRTWDTSDVALVAAVAAESGHAVVAFKEPGSARALQTGVRSAVSAATVAAGLELLRVQGAQVLELYDAIGAAHVRMDANSAAALRSNALVDYVEPQQHGTILGIRGRFAKSHKVHVVTQTVPWGIALIGAPSAHAVTTGAGAKIQIIDSGHDQGREDLPLVPDLNCSGSSGGCNDTYPNSHGTHVLGIFTARNNSVGVLGVAPGVNPADVYVYGACSSGGSCPTTEVTAGINTAIFTANVLNLSIGQPFDVTQSNAIAQAWNNGIVIVAAAGNNGAPGEVSYPASYTNVIGVSGVQPDKSFASTSPCGSWSNSGFNVDLGAPFWALSTVPGDGYEDETEGWCGTSMAAPHVAGVAALVKAKNPTWTNQQVVDKLFATAEDLGPAGRDDQFGYGLVKAAAAVDAAPLAPPTNCTLQKIPPPSNNLKVSWTNGDPSASTEVSIWHSGVWTVVHTESPGITQYFYTLGGQTGLFQARVRHLKSGSTPSAYCLTNTVTV